MRPLAATILGLLLVFLFCFIYQHRLEEKIADLERATGCPVVEESRPGCSPFVIPIGRSGKMVYVCCPPKKD